MLEEITAEYLQEKRDHFKVEEKFMFVFEKVGKSGFRFLEVFNRPGAGVAETLRFVE